MNRIIFSLAVLGLTTFVLSPGRAMAQRHGGGGHGGGGHGGGHGGGGHGGGHGGFHPSSIRPQGGMGMSHPGSGHYHQPAPAYHTSQPHYTAPSYHAPAPASSQMHSSHYVPTHSGATVSIPSSSQRYAAGRTGTASSAGTTVSVRRPSNASGSTSVAARRATAGATVSLRRRVGPGATGVAVGGKRPTELGKLPGQKLPSELSRLPRPQQTGLNRLNGLVSNGTVRFPANGLNLTGDPTGAITGFLSTLAGMSEPPVVQTVLGDIASGQPLSGSEILVALGTLPDLPPDVQNAVAQGIVDNLVNNNPGQFANNNAGQGGNNAGTILSMIGQLVQNLPNGGAGAGGGGAVAGGGDAGSDSGPAVAGAPVGGSSGGGGDAGDPPIVQNGGYPSTGGTITQFDNPAGASNDAPPAGDDAVRQFRRYLRVKNDSNAKLTVYVQYSAFMDNGTFQWFPALPGGDQAVGFTVAAGETVDVDHDGWRVKGDRVRIWAVADDGTEVTDFRDQDLWLVAEQNGERTYYAPDLETFTFTFGS